MLVHFILLQQMLKLFLSSWFSIYLAFYHFGLPLCNFTCLRDAVVSTPKYTLFYIKNKKIKKSWHNILKNRSCKKKEIQAKKSWFRSYKSKGWKNEGTAVLGNCQHDDELELQSLVQWGCDGGRGTAVQKLKRATRTRKVSEAKLQKTLRGRSQSKAAFLWIQSRQ